MVDIVLRLVHYELKVLIATGKKRAVFALSDLYGLHEGRRLNR